MFNKCLIASYTFCWLFFYQFLKNGILLCLLLTVIWISFGGTLTKTVISLTCKLNIHSRILHQHTTPFHSIFNANVTILLLQQLFYDQSALHEIRRSTYTYLFCIQNQVPIHTPYRSSLPWAWPQHIFRFQFHRLVPLQPSYRRHALFHQTSRN